MTGVQTCALPILAAGHVQRESISSPDELAKLALFAELRQILGAGESSCLTLAEKRGWIVACDEKRVFLREATRRLGAGRILNTPGIYVLGIQGGSITVAAADEGQSHPGKTSVSNGVPLVLRCTVPLEKG